MDLGLSASKCACCGTKDKVVPLLRCNAVKEKHAINHVATVVASDGRTIITSEVNAAFAGKKDPWFAMYEGGQGFYNAFKLEYTQLFSSGNNLIRVEPHVEYDDIDQD